MLTQTMSVPHALGLLEEDVFAILPRLQLSALASSMEAQWFSKCKLIDQSPNVGGKLLCYTLHSVWRGGWWRGTPLTPQFNC